MNTLKVKRLLLSPELFAAFFKEPDVELLIESDTFAPVNLAADSIPALWVTFTKQLREKPAV